MEETHAFKLIAYSRHRESEQIEKRDRFISMKGDIQNV